MTEVRYEDGRRYKGRYQKDAIEFFEALREDPRGVLIDSVTVRGLGRNGYQMDYWVVPLSRQGVPCGDPERRFTHLRHVPDWYVLNTR